MEYTTNTATGETTVSLTETDLYELFRHEFGGQNYPRIKREALCRIFRAEQCGPPVRIVITDATAASQMNPAETWAAGKAMRTTWTYNEAYELRNGCATDDEAEFFYKYSEDSGIGWRTLRNLISDHKRKRFGEIPPAVAEPPQTIHPTHYVATGTEGRCGKCGAYDRVTLSEPCEGG